MSAAEQKLEMVPNPQMLIDRGLALPVLDYRGVSPRLIGFQRLETIRKPIRDRYDINFDTPEVTALKDNLFRTYCKNDETLPPDIEKALIDLIDIRLKRSTTGKLSVRRAFWTPEESDPPGLRFNALEDSQVVLEKIKAHFKYALNQGWGDREDVEVALNLQEFVDTPRPIIEENRLVGGRCPFGGTVIPEGDGYYRVYGVLGDNRATTTNDETDTTLIHVDEYSANIVESSVTAKTCLRLDRGSDGGFSLPITLPTHMQIAHKAVSDSYALNMATVAHELNQSFGPQKVEFSAGVTKQGRITTYINEVQPYNKPEAVEREMLQGKIVAVVNDLKDIDSLGEIRTPKGKEAVVVLGGSVLKDPASLKAVLSRLKEMSLNIVFVPKNETTHLFLAIATQVKDVRGYTILPKKIYRVGDMVVVGADGIVVNLNRAGSIESAYSLSEYPLLLKAASVGNKAVGLQLLAMLGHRVPPAIALTSEFFKATLTRNKLLTLWSHLNIALPEASQYTSTEDFKLALELELIRRFTDIREGLKILPKRWNEAISLLQKNLNGAAEKDLVVRSSALIEDIAATSDAGNTPRSSFAGSFLTVLGARLKPTANQPLLEEAVLEVMRSAFSDGVAKEIAGLSPEDGRIMLDRLIMPVIIMPKIDAQVSGTVFHMDPLTGARDVVTIQAQKGVEGAVRGDDRKLLTVKLNASTGVVISITISEGGFIRPISESDLTTRQNTLLTAEEINTLFRSMREAHHHLKFYPDMEWCIDADSLFSLQIRPLQDSKTKEDLERK